VQGRSVAWGFLCRRTFHGRGSAQTEFWSFSLGGIQPPQGTGHRAQRIVREFRCSPAVHAAPRDCPSQTGQMATVRPGSKKHLLLPTDLFHQLFDFLLPEQRANQNSVAGLYRRNIVHPNDSKQKIRIGN